MRHTTAFFAVVVGMTAALACGVPKETALDAAGPAPDASADGGRDAGADGGRDVVAAVDQQGGPDSGDPVPTAKVNVAGRWAMFAFEDPVAVEIVQTGNTLTGTGCYGGLPTAREPRDAITEFTCAPLRGSVEGHHVKFSFASPGVPYAADVYASADGQRMAGRFHTTGEWTAAFAWLRIGSNDRWLPLPATTTLTQTLTSRAGLFTLQPVSAPPAAVEVGRNGYVLLLATSARGPQIAGPLGSFWATEMTWNATEQTLTAGPVPASSAGTPIKLVLRFDGMNLLTCEATMPSGEVFAFTATRGTI